MRLDCVLLVFVSFVWPGVQLTSFAHGGTYFGPGTGVPPGGPPVGAPLGPSTASPSGPASASTSGGASDDLASWQLWWALNRDGYLDLRKRLHRSRTQSGVDDATPRSRVLSDNPARPSASTLQQKVVPALCRALKSEKNPDLVTGCLLALGKIGEDPLEPKEPSLVDVLRPYLKEPSQEVAETAAVALGVSARSACAPLLSEILEDSSIGRAATGRDEIPYRTREFAAYGLGLIAHRAAGNPDIGRYAVHHLAASLESDTSAARDVKVACLMALGLAKLEQAAAPKPPKGETPGPSTSAAAEREFLRSYFANERNPDLVRAYAPVNVSRLCAGADAEFIEAWKSALCASIGSRAAAPPAVQQGAAIALGLVGDGDGDFVDQRLRDGLRKASSEGDALARRFALISIARVGARRGLGAPGGEEPQSARRFLLRGLDTGSTPTRPWAALALGVLEWDNRAGGGEESSEVRRAIRRALESHASPGERGAYCIAAGLVHDAEAIPLARSVLKEGADDNVRAHAAIALGLLEDKESIPNLRATVVDSLHRPVLLRDASIALGLLGDAEIVPLLLQLLRDAQNLASQSAIASALGLIGDERSIDPLLAILGDEKRPAGSRAFAAVALGITCDKEALPWNAKLSADVNYGLPPATLLDPGTGMGILDLF